MQCEAANEVSLLCAWVGIYACEDRDREGVGDFYVLAGFQSQVGDCKTVGFGVERSTVRYGTYCRCPVERSQFEGCGQLYIGRIGSVAVFVHSVISSKVGIPVDSQRAKVIADVSLKHMARLVSLVSEVLVVGRVKPVVCHADVETSCRVCSCEVELFGVVFVRQTNVASCR